VIETVASADFRGAGSPEQAVTEFVSDHGALGAAWGRSPVIVREAGLTKWFPTVAELLSSPYVSLLGPPYITLMAAGKTISPERYCRRERVVMYGKVEQMLDLDRVEAEVEAGAAVKLNRMELWCPPVAAMARAIGRARGRQVKVWGFQSPQGENMVPAHRDPAHVLAVQIAGQKHWRLEGRCPEHSWSGLAPVEASEKPLIDVLGPDDVLYMPHGFAHSAAAGTTTSYHVSFAVEGTTAGELRTQVVRLLYDQVDRADATEIGPANVIAVLEEMRSTLGELSERLSKFARDDLAAVSSHDVQGILGRLGTSSEQP
jgi:hypothetical protein